MPVIVKKTDLQKTLDAAKQNYGYASTFTDPKSAARIYKSTADSCVGALLTIKSEHQGNLSRSLVFQAIHGYTRAAIKYDDAGRNVKANKNAERGLYVLGAYGFDPINQRELDQVNLLLATAKYVKAKALNIILSNDLTRALRTGEKR